MADKPPRPSFAKEEATIGNGKNAPPPKPEPDPLKVDRKLTRSGEAVRKQLSDFFGGVAVFLTVAGDDHCAEVIANNREPLAEAYARLADRNPRIKAFLERLTVGSAYTEVVAITVTTALPIAAHHSPHVRAILANSPLMGILATDSTLMGQVLADQGHPVTKVDPDGTAERVRPPSP